MLSHYGIDSFRSLPSRSFDPRAAQLDQVPFVYVSINLCVSLAPCSQAPYCDFLNRQTRAIEVPFRYSHDPLLTSFSKEPV